MSPIVKRSKIGEDGILNLSIPIGKSCANQEVRITIEPFEEARSSEMSVGQWKQFVEETAGSIEDDSFHRHSQGEFEQRQELFP